jgi:amidophosphoribosyltransferase
MNLIGELVRDKRVIIVDDSIVRGTTSKARVNNLKEAGAKEVHVLVSCPPHMNPCVYGIDFPDRSKLMAANHTIDEIRQYLNADSLAYLSKEGMVRATGLPKEVFCMACYDGNYPVPYDSQFNKNVIERRRSRVEGLGKPWPRRRCRSNCCTRTLGFRIQAQLRPAAVKFADFRPRSHALNWQFAHPECRSHEKAYAAWR